MISSYQVQVFERTFDDKGKITSITLNEQLSGVVNANSAEVARFIAQQRAVEGVETGDATALTAAFDKYVINVSKISVIGD